MSRPKERANVIIIGGGPAGLSAACWCSELGLSTILIEKERAVGGQLHHIYNPIENYLGTRFDDGLEMLSAFRQSLKRFESIRIVRGEVIEVGSKARSVTLADQTRLFWDALIVATGVRRRRLGIAGETDFRDRGILNSGVRQKESVKGKIVLVVGGGDAAIENALLLSDVASDVKVVHRGSILTAREEFLDSIVHRKNVTILTETLLKDITGNSVVRAARLENTSTGVCWDEPVDAILIRVGVVPNTELFKDILDLDSRGYVKVNSSCETSLFGIYAIGDVANPIAPTISTAVGTGATASKTIFHNTRNKTGVK